MNGSLTVDCLEMDYFFGRLLSYEVDLGDVRSQEFAKRALVGRRQR